jgi:hypothetical protein
MDFVEKISTTTNPATLIGSNSRNPRIVCFEPLNGLLIEVEVNKALFGVESLLEMTGQILGRLANGNYNRRMVFEAGEPLPNPALLQARLAALTSMLETQNSSSREVARRARHRECRG